MLVLKNQVKVSPEDDFLYDYLIDLLFQVKILLGGNEISYTLRNHPKIYKYLLSKQRNKFMSIEDLYFNPDGSLNSSFIKEYHQRVNLNKNTIKS